MAKIRLLAVISINGRLPMNAEESTWWLNPTKYGIEELRLQSDLVVEDSIPIQELMNNLSNNSKSVLVIANDNTVELINELQNRRLLEELVLYTVPVITGTGTKVLDSPNAVSYWTVEECFSYPEHITKIVYRHLADSEDIS